MGGVLEMTPESKIKKEITAYLTSIGAWYDNPVRTGYGRRGVPDIVVCYRGYFLAIEVKASESKKPTLWQAREIAAVQAARGRAVVAWSVRQVQSQITLIDYDEDGFDDGDDL